MSELPELQPLLQKTTSYLESRGISNARRESEWLFMHFLGLTRLDLYTRFDMLLEEEQVAVLRAAVQRRGKREPLAYILGSQDFYGLTLQVSPAVLVPRAETEELVELILKQETLRARSIEDFSCIDVGTGSGALILALKQQCPDWQMSAVDVSDDALLIAQDNAEKYDLSVRFLKSDLLGFFCDSAVKQFDLIVANLPYIADSERELCDPELAFEPDIALYADDDGLALMKRCTQEAESLLNDGGVIYYEHGYRHGAAFIEWAQADAWYALAHQDSAGHHRITQLSRQPFGV